MGNYRKLFSTTKRNSLNGADLQDKINELHNYYMPKDLNKAMHQNKITAIKKLEFILKYTSRSKLQEADFEELISCALTLIYYFGMRLKLNRLSSKLLYWHEKRLFQRAESVFQLTMDLLQPEQSGLIIKLTLDFFSEVELWPFESFVGQILEVVLYFTRGKIILFNLMLTDIHYILFNDVKSARHRMRVLYELLNSNNWVINKQKLLPFVTRLLDFFAYSITRDTKVNAYGYLRKGFEVCLRRIFERVENQHRILIITTMLNWFSLVNMGDDYVLEFSSLLNHAAELYKVEIYSNSFKEGLIEHVLCNLIGSSNAMYSLVGSRLMQRFLDRQKNAACLLVPSLYYEFSQVHLKIGPCEVGDKAFIRHHREKLHSSILRAVQQHCSSSINVKSVFTVIGCMVLEVPCGLTAAAAACMVMTIQDFAINAENLTATSRYWMHAIVVSLMSLIGWVHKAPLLYRYVNQIIARRAKEAPQLNPPLMSTYSIGHHHVTWNKPTLFFEDWELRYALWKHFQDRRVSILTRAQDKLNKKVPAMDVQN